MHQTFYVDVDEEVNSIISRLRKSTSKYNILAVAQQALILQSSVSLRLIKKEMDMLKKKIMIVTQDERGLAMAQKVGFPVKKTIDEVNRIQETDNSQVPIMVEKKEDAGEKALSDYNRLKNLGDSNYVIASDVPIETPVRSVQVQENKDNQSNSPSFNLQNQRNNAEFKDLFVEKIQKTPEKNIEPSSIHQSAGKNLWIFVSISIFLLIIIFAYLFFPKAEVNVEPKKIQKNINLTVNSQENTQDKDYPADVIALDSIVVEEDDVLSLFFDSTGQKASATKKARGTIIIYNNFSETSQILVATTRFLSEDGKLFRLIKNVTVPGMRIENGEKIGGEIRAEIVADSAGGEFNIEPTTFKIPGFEGSPKYDKFGARSEEKMKGGGDGESELRTISQEDVDKAKEEALVKAKIQLAEKIQKIVTDKNVFLEDAIEYEVLDSASFPEVGAIADNFEYQLKMRARYLTFSSAEIDKKVDEYMNENVLAKQDFPVSVVKAVKKYGVPKNNFTDKSIEVKLTVDVILQGAVSSEIVKRELLGAGQDGVDKFMASHPEIQKIDARITPDFLASKIPKYQSRVKVNILE